MKTIFRLLRFLKPFYRDVLLSVLAGIATIGAGIGMLGTSAFLIASAALHPSIADLQVAIVGVRFFGISRSVFRYLERLVSHSVNLKVLAYIRVWFYRQIEPQAPAGLQKVRSGDLLNRIMSDLETLENFYVRVISPLLVAIVITLGMSLFLGGYFLELGLILFGGMAINGILLPVISILLTRRSSEELLKARSDLGVSMIEMFQGLEDLQTTGAENRWLQAIRKSDMRLAAIQTFNGTLTGINNGLVLLVANCTVLAVLAAAIPRVMDGTIAGVSLAVVTLLTMASFEAANPLPLAAQNLMASIDAGKRLFELAMPIRPQEVREDTVSQSVDVQQVKMSHLGFTYPEANEFSLEDISLLLERGKKVALVGPSGAGKTSLVNILLGFWGYNEGDILFDGVDMHRFGTEAARKVFGVISQSTYIFSESLRSNLLLAKPEATEADLYEVLKKAELWHWYINLPNGLDTWLGERGVLMSGGERQRLAIARVLLQDRPFIILDEPTSNLDPKTENQVIDTLLSTLADRGILLITHQMNLLSKMDAIYFISNGRIVEAGTEAKLLAHNGEYARFFKLQNQIFSE